MPLIFPNFMNRDSNVDSLLDAPFASTPCSDKDSLWQEFISRIEACSDASDCSVDYSDIDSYSKEFRNLLDGIFAYSPYLTNLLLRETETFLDLCEGRSGGDVDVIIRRAGSLLSSGDKLLDIDYLMGELRLCKRRVMLVLALRDLSCGISLSELTFDLSSFADVSVEVALSHAWHYFCDRGYVDEGCDSVRGIFVLGMGKLGGYELNYSSDIDLILLFDSAVLPFRDEHGSRIQEILNRGVKRFIQILDSVNRDGFVFRVDLELRPDPLSTPVIVSVSSALQYYAGVGQAWERAAMIKARIIAGDSSVGQLFLNDLMPFVWRKSLDYYALAEIGDIRKRMLRLKGGDGDIFEVRGFNIKLSFGGIREIEFLLQSQQLIWGGRKIELRSHMSMEALHGLVEMGILPSYISEPIERAYIFFRQVEHRLQMVGNEQTQTLPSDDVGLLLLANFCGFASIDDFSDSLRYHVEIVRDLSQQHGLHRKGGVGVSSGGDSGGDSGDDSGDDSGRVLFNIFVLADLSDESRDLLCSYGFDNCKVVHGLINGWLHGKYRCVRSQDCITQLGNLLPLILEQCLLSGSADSTLVLLDNFLEHLPFGVQFFSLLGMHPHLFEQLFAILGGASALGLWLSSHPHLLYALLEDQIIDSSGEGVGDDLSLSLRSDIVSVMRDARDFEDNLNILSDWLNDQKFLFRVKYFTGFMDIVSLMGAETDLAALTIEVIFPKIVDSYNGTLIKRSVSKGEVIERDFSSVDICEHCCVVGFGKFGSGELLPESDLDLVFLYDGDIGFDIYGISPMVYYVRLCQRLLTSFSGGGGGSLYSIDMRLRPNGDDSSVATAVDRFGEYYLSGEAWVWELMSLLRARIIFGGVDFCERFNDIKRQIFSIERDRDKILVDLLEMWRTTCEYKQAGGSLDIKNLRGGMLDFEYIIGAHRLLHVVDLPQLIGSSTCESIDILRGGSILSESEALDLRRAYDVWMSLSSAMRLLSDSSSLSSGDLTGLQVSMVLRILSESCDIGDGSDVSVIDDIVGDISVRVSGQFSGLFGI